MAKNTQNAAPKVNTSTLDAHFGKLVAFAFNRPGKGSNAGGTVKTVSLAPRKSKPGADTREGRFNLHVMCETLYAQHKAPFNVEDVRRRLEGIGHQSVKTGDGFTVYPKGVDPKSSNSSNSKVAPADMLAAILSS